MTTVPYVLYESDVVVVDMEHIASAVDTTPPTFGGVTGLTVTQTTIEVVWTAATDDISEPSALVYEVHVSKTEAAPFNVRAVSEPGATVVIVEDLAPGTTYFVRVRARDEAGNVSTDGGVELQATTTADQPPTFGGATAAVALDHESIAVSWNAASDDMTNPGAIVYEVHVSKTAGGSFVVRAVSDPGARSCTVDGLNANTTYHVRARARDGAGNVSTDGGVELQATTPDDIASHPTISIVSPNAGDEITPSTPIVFDVVDDSGVFRRAVVLVTFAETGVSEVVHDGDSFAPFYAGSSSRQMIAGGFRFTVLRMNGWRSAPSVKVIAVDREGFEV